MARIARDSTPKRRSARLSNNQPQSTKRIPSSNLHLDAVLERDETPDAAEQQSIDNVIATPSTRQGIESRLRELSKITTPKTEPKPANEQMHPGTIHQTTAKAPDSGMKLGFADLHTTGRASLESLQNTPSRPRQSLAQTNISPSFQFKFSRETNLSEAGRKLMESIREDAAKIKEQLRAEKELQEQKDAEADGMFESGAGRKIAKPAGRAGRFSDVHMAQFKKMDSIANHASAYRANPSFARPTAQSLKRSSSRADLDEPERPRTAGKSPSTRIPPPVTGRLGSTSPFKSIRPNSDNENDAPAKRVRLQGDDDVSTSRTTTALPRPVSSRLLSPTKASAARTAEGTSTPAKPSALPRSNSVKSVRSVSRPSAVALPSPTKPAQPQFDKPLPPTPGQTTTSPSKVGLVRSESTRSLAPEAREAGSSRIPMMASLKSILRSPRKNATTTQAATPKHITSIPVPASSQKKVDFTPSVKSRYAVKLAEASPSPAKLDRSKANDDWQPAIPYDSSAFVVSSDQDWEDDDSDLPVDYPALPNLSPRPASRAGPVDHTIHHFTAQAKEHGRRESKEFKSIFTTLHPKPDTTRTLTSVNTTVNRTNPIINASRVAVSPPKSQTSQSPSTIRQVRVSEPVQPFEDRVATVPHGLPAKKRRMDSNIANDKFGTDDDAKENRRITHHAHIPGAWNDSTVEADADEGEKRGGKRARITKSEEPEKEMGSVSPVKKPSAARELAAKTAKERKVKASIGGPGTGSASGGGRKSALSLSRLNMLARPKSRG